MSSVIILAISRRWDITVSMTFMLQWGHDLTSHENTLIPIADNFVASCIELPQIRFLLFLLSLSFINLLFFSFLSYYCFLQLYLPICHLRCFIPIFVLITSFSSYSYFCFDLFFIGSLYIRSFFRSSLTLISSAFNTWPNFMHF